MNMAIDDNGFVVEFGGVDGLAVHANKCRDKAKREERERTNSKARAMSHRESPAERCPATHYLSLAVMLWTTSLTASVGLLP